MTDPTGRQPGPPPTTRRRPDGPRVAHLGPIGRRPADLVPLVGDYCEQVWPIRIGPTGVLLARHLARALAASPAGVDVDLAEIAAELGVATSRLGPALDRLAAHGLLTRPSPDSIGLSGYAPLLTDHQLRRSPPSTIAAHRALRPPPQPATPAPLVSAAAARAHLAHLAAAGAGTRSLAAAAGVTRGTIRAVLTGGTTRIRAATNTKLLAVTAADLPHHSLVDAAPTRALLAHLAELGYPEYWVAAQLQPLTARPRLQIGRQRVRAGTAAAIAALAAHLDPPNPPVRPQP